MCFRKKVSSPRYEYAIKKVPAYELKYYKCFGFKPINEQLEELSDWEYLSTKDANFTNKFWKEYRTKIEDDEKGPYDTTRLVTVKLNSKFAQSSSLTKCYHTFFNKYYPSFNFLRKRRRQRIWRVPVDLILFALFALIAVVSFSLSSTLNELFNYAVPSSLGERFLSFFHLASDALPDFAYIIAAAVSAILSVTFLCLFVSLLFISSKIDSYRDKYIIPSLHSAYINRKYFISQNPTLMTASQRSNYIQMRVYRAAQKDDDGDEFD